MAILDNRQYILDSRDIINEIDELDTEQSTLVDEYIAAKEEADELAEDGEWYATERLINAINALSSYWDVAPEEVDDSVEALDDPADGFNGLQELADLKALAEQCEDAPDWLYGATLIRESYFESYAQELAEDIGAINSDAQWPTCHIDWKAAAEALKMDYSEVEFDGVTYLIRS